MIDVSNHNSHVNWERVAAAGHRIAAIKASEGSNHYKGTFYDDAFFSYNMNGAKANGIVACPYYFARPGTPAIPQARHFLEICHNHLNYGSGKLILDIEDDAGLTNAELCKWVEEFCSTIESVVHRLTPLYSYSAFVEKFGKQFVKNPLWIANYDFKPQLPLGAIGAWPTKMVYAHQYSDKGTCPGIVGDVDLSHRFVSLRKFTINKPVRAYFGIGGRPSLL